jgi:hypothetical protein
MEKYLYLLTYSSTNSVEKKIDLSIADNREPKSGRRKEGGQNNNSNNNSNNKGTTTGNSSGGGRIERRNETAPYDKHSRLGDAKDRDQRDNNRDRNRDRDRDRRDRRIRSPERNESKNNYVCQVVYLDKQQR